MTLSPVPCLLTLAFLTLIFILHNRALAPPAALLRAKMSASSGTPSPRGSPTAPPWAVPGCQLLSEGSRDVSLAPSLSGSPRHPWGPALPCRLGPSRAGPPPPNPAGCPVVPSNGL